MANRRVLATGCGRGSGGAYPGPGGFPSAGGAWFGDGGFSYGGFSSGGFSPGGSGGRVFDAGSDPNRNQVPPGRVCDRVATIVCAGFDYCCPRPPTLPVEQCRAAFMSTCGSSIAVDEASASPATAYDIERATAAFTEFEKRASEWKPLFARKRFDSPKPTDGNPWEERLLPHGFAASEPPQPGQPAGLMRPSTSP